MKDYRNLKAWQDADSLLYRVYEETARFPSEEKYNLTSQLRRAALSVPSNIVEGCSRDGLKEQIHFLSIAFASAKEVHYQLTVAVGLAFLETDSIVSHADDVCRTIRALLNAWRKDAANPRRERSDRPRSANGAPSEPPQ